MLRMGRLVRKDGAGARSMPELVAEGLGLDASGDGRGRKKRSLARRARAVDEIVREAVARFMRAGKRSVVYLEAEDASAQ